MTLDELLKRSDFVIVSCPLNNETKGMFNAAAFGKMKASSIFINVARGGNTMTRMRSLFNNLIKIISKVSYNKMP